MPLEDATGGRDVVTKCIHWSHQLGAECTTCCGQPLLCSSCHVHKNVSGYAYRSQQQRGTIAAAAARGNAVHYTRGKTG
jgi:hypothetical protein